MLVCYFFLKENVSMLLVMLIFFSLVRTRYGYQPSVAVQFLILERGLNKGVLI